MAITTETRAERRARRLAELAMERETTGEAPSQLGGPSYSLTVNDVQMVEGGEQEAPLDISPAQQGQLAALAFEINTRLERADRLDALSNDHRLAAALQLAEAQKVCVAHKLNFKRWVEVSVPKSWETVRRLVKVGQADDPRAALEDLRASNRELNRAARARARLEKAAEPEEAEPETPAQIAAPVEEVAEAAPEPVAQPEAVAAEAAPVEEVVDAAPAPSVEEPDAPPVDTVEAIMFALAEMSLAARAEVARRATLGLPTPDVRKVLDDVAKQIGMVVTRAKHGANYFVTIAGVMMDFERLSEHEQREFIVNASEKIGALVELPK